MHCLTTCYTEATVSRIALAPMGPAVNPDSNLVLSMTGRKLTKTQ